MNNFKKSIIVGKGAGISKYLSLNLGIKAINFKELKNINFLDYENIIYTSVDPSNNLVNSNVYSYINKNFRSIFYILESEYRGNITYLSSVDSGPYQIRQEKLSHQTEEMFTPYSFSKYCAESLFLNHKNFQKCNILRLGLLWPTKYDSNFFYAALSNPDNIKFNLNSEYYVTPYSLVLKYIKKSLEDNKNKIDFGYLTSTNKVTLLSLLNKRDLKFKFSNEGKYFYKTREKDKNLINLTQGNWFDWEKEDDFNNLIAEVLHSSGKEDLLPNWN